MGKQEKKRPLLSIITVVRNDPENLARTMESVCSQSFTQYELIVIDGNSSDDTLQVIKRYKEKIAQWVSEPDRSLYDAMNKGIRMAAGKYIEFLNAGDTYIESTSLESIFSEVDKDYDVIYGEINLLDEEDTFLCRVPALDFTLENLKRFGTGTVNHQAFFIKKSKAPLFNLRYKLKAELNWYIDILSQNKALTFNHIPIAIIEYKQGGKGYQHFWRNLCEWICLVQSRFGLMQNIRNRKSYWKFIKYRYPFLKNIKIF